MYKKFPKKRGGEAENAETLHRLATTQDLPQTPHSVPHGLRGISHVLSTMGRGLACQHLSESAFTQDRWDLAILPTVQNKSVPVIQPSSDPTNLCRSATTSNRILVVGQEWGFSDQLMTKALGLAQRNACGVVALNIIPLGKSFFSALSNSAKEEIMALVAQSVIKFREKISSMGIPFSQLTRVGTENVVAEEVNNNLKLISFILVEANWKKEAIPASVAIHYVESSD